MRANEQSLVEEVAKAVGLDPSHVVTAQLPDHRLKKILDGDGPDARPGLWPKFVGAAGLLLTLTCGFNKIAPGLQAAFGSAGVVSGIIGSRSRRDNWQSARNEITESAFRKHRCP